MVDLVTMGWLTVDNIILEDGVAFMGVLGGGALYSAMGARVWSPSVGIHAAAGRSRLAETESALARYGIDAAGLSTARGDGIAFWLLHESEVHKQQVAMKTSQPPLELDEDRGPLPASYAGAKGFHIAPQGPRSGFAAARTLSGGPSVVTMDILSDAIIDAGLYRDLAWTAQLDAFLPSETEIMDVWSPADPVSWLSDRAREGKCHMVGKFGSRGVVVAEAQTGKLLHVPAVKVKAIDTTGAGDAFCGGFLAGLAAGKSLRICAAMGTVSASYIVATRGVPELDKGIPSDHDDRCRQVLAGITEDRTQSR